MGYNRPKLSELATQIENDIYTRFGGTSRPVRFSVNKILSRVLAGSIHLVYGYIDFCMKQIIVDSASSEYLERWALVWGLKKKLPNKSEGVAEFRGNDDSKIRAFTQIQTSDNFIFQTLFDAEIKDGFAQIKIQALIPCLKGNMKGGVSLNLVSPISGVQSVCVLDKNGTFNGADKESDNSLRDRVLDRIRNAPCAGNKKDYETWCLQVSGVTRAWCYPQYQTEGNVGLSFVRDNDDTIIPNEAQLQEVFQTISNVMPCTAILKVFAPTANKVDFKIKSNDVSSEFQKQVSDQLKFLFFNIANPNSIIYISDILESLASIKTISRILLVSPTQDIILDDKSVGIVGNVVLERF
ncbi:MAG: baseplate J/gp47 family protein [Bdellovibrionota bacterium]